AAGTDGCAPDAGRAAGTDGCAPEAGRVTGTDECAPEAGREAGGGADEVGVVRAPPGGGADELAPVRLTAGGGADGLAPGRSAAGGGDVLGAPARAGGALPARADGKTGCFTVAFPSRRSSLASVRALAASSRKSAYALFTRRKSSLAVCWMSRSRRANRLG